MKKLICILAAAIMTLMMSSFAFAKEGDLGYEGGITSGQNIATSKSATEYEYQEVVFITGKPIVFKGKVNIKKKSSKDTETTTYTYTADNAKNNLKRTISLVSKITKKDNNQIIKETTILGKPSEVLTFDKKVYTLDSYAYTKSSIIDVKPATDYFAGNITGKKVYKNKDGTEIITVSITNKFNGYDQFWSNGELQVVEYFVQSENKSSTASTVWSGRAKVKASTASTSDLEYSENYPEDISFEGGYLESQKIVSKLTYESNMPEFDLNGIATDRIKTEKGNLKLESFPNKKRLVTHDLAGARGHWAEEDIAKLYSLEIYDEDPEIFIPNQYLTRAEFAKAVAKTVNIQIPLSKTKTKVSSPYFDVPVTNPYFPYIQQLTIKKVLNGYEDGNFSPDEPIRRAQAITTFIKLLGLERMSKDEYPITNFKDNDDIPSWALRAIQAGYKIGVVKGDDGYVRPNEYLTKAEAATLINRLIDYMRKDMAKSYGDNILNY